MNVNVRVACAAMSALMVMTAAEQARAQGTPATPWSVDASIGWDNSISGDFLSGGIGTLQGLPVVIENRSWGDVYGTGIFLNFAAGYALNDLTELRAGFTYQSTGSDDTQSIGTFRGGPLFASFSNYKSWGIDLGYRRYFSESEERWRPYAGGSVGFGGVSGIEADLAQTGTNVVLTDTDFYEGNGAITFGANGGVLYRLTDQVSLDARIGLRYVSGLSNLESDLFTGLDDVNEGSSRWTLPLTVGAKFRF